MPWTGARSGASGVEESLCRTVAPVAPSARKTSVKVPPTSRPILSAPRVPMVVPMVVPMAMSSLYWLQNIAMRHCLTDTTN